MPTQLTPDCDTPACWELCIPVPGLPTAPCRRLHCSLLPNNACGGGEANIFLSTFKYKHPNSDLYLQITHNFASLLRVYVLYMKAGSHNFLCVESSMRFIKHHRAHFRRIHCWKMICSECFINQHMSNHICRKKKKKSTKINPNKNNRTIIAWRFWLPINYNPIQLHDNLCFQLRNHSGY